MGRGIAHFHQHLFVQHPGTPEGYAWTDVDGWPGAPQGGPSDAAELCGRLAPYLSRDGSTRPPAD